MQGVLPFLASLVIPTVRDDTLHIFHIALLSGARVFEVAQKMFFFPELRTPSLPPSPPCSGPVPLCQGSFLYLCSVAREFHEPV